MADRASVFQVANIRAEATPGTDPGTGTKRFQSMGIELNPKASVKTFRAQGSKFITVAALGREWAEAGVTGMATYTEIVYALASILRKTTPTAMAGGTLAYSWLFDIVNDAADDIQTYTIEQGSAERAHKSTYNFFTELGVNWTNDGVEISGAIMGRAIADAITLAASPTRLEIVPVMTTQTQIFVATTQAGLAGASAITRGFRASFNISNRSTSFWPINSAVSSFGGQVEIVPTATLKLLMEADAAGMAFLPVMRAGDTYFVRVKSTGATIEATNKYLLQLDFSGKVTEPGDFSDEDGVYATEWTFTAAYDATWNKTLEFLVQNQQSAL